MTQDMWMIIVLTCTLDSVNPILMAISSRMKMSGKIKVDWNFYVSDNIKEKLKFYLDNEFY